MDALQIELAKLRRDANLSQSIQDVDKIIEQLENARESVVSGTENPSHLRHGEAGEKSTLTA
jgi:hypothetical protein